MKQAPVVSQASSSAGDPREVVVKEFLISCLILFSVAASAAADIPTIAFNPISGGLDSVIWHNRELLTTTNGNRKSTVPNAHLRSIDGNILHYEMAATGSDVTVQFTPVEDGIDLHLSVTGEGNEDIDVFLGQFAYSGQIKALRPIYAGSLIDVKFPQITGLRYHYPGDFGPSMFSPVYALWDNQYTVGFSVLADVGDQIEVQIWEPKNSTPGAMVNFGLMEACEPGDQKSYDMTIRFAEGSQKWRQVLQPYRQHQFLRDGPVQYERIGPILFYNLRNSHKYDYHGSHDFEPGTTWESALGSHWDTWMQQRADGEMNFACTGVWAQQEQLAAHLEFNPDVLDLEKSLDGSLTDLVARFRQDYGDFPLMVMARPTKRVVNNAIEELDLTDPNDWNAALSQLQGLADLGFDIAYADQLGIYDGWESVDLAESSPIRLISEWSWDRMITRASCVNVHPNFPEKDAGLLIPYLTPGGELFVRAFPERAPLFAQGIVTPWSQWVSEEDRPVYNTFASYLHPDGTMNGAENEPDDNVRDISLMWDGIGDSRMGPAEARDNSGVNLDQPDDPTTLVTLLVQPGPDGRGNDVGSQRIVRLITGRSSLTLAEVQQYIAGGTKRIVVNKRRWRLPIPDHDDSGDGSDGDGSGGT